MIQSTICLVVSYCMKSTEQMRAKMFPDRGRNFSGLKHWSEKITAVAALTHILLHCESEKLDFFSFEHNFSKYSPIFTARCDA